MKQFVLVLTAVFLLGISTSAQEPAQTSPNSTFAFGGETAPATANLFAANPFSVSPASSGASSSSLAFESQPEASNAEGVAFAASGPPPQGVYGVRPVFPFEAYLGYTFFRFYEVPGTTETMNGFNYSIVYYPKSWIGADGEFVLALGSLNSYHSKFLLGLGGVRVRAKPLRRNIEIWAHALAGGTHFTPQTAYGKEGAFAYELGVGADLDLRGSRYAIRAGADMVGSTYFGTYQVSPKISIGAVYRF